MRTINAKELRASLPEIVRRVQKGERLTVLYRSRPAFRIIPPSDEALANDTELADEALYHLEPAGHSDDGLSSRDHDAVLYGKATK